MKKRWELLVAVWACLSVVSARAQSGAKPGAAGGQPVAAHTDSSSVGKTEPATDDASYVIGPSDALDIVVWKELDFSHTVEVRPDGKISLPLLNDIQAAGLTPMQLAASISIMLRKYVTQPQVTVILRAMNSRRVYVLGNVNRPGPISLLPSMTVLQALSTAGGLSQFADQKRIYVLRNERGKQTRYPFNYKLAVRGGAAKENLVLKPGDTIVVP